MVAAVVLDRPTAPSARAYALLSVGAALVTIALKTGAYVVTASVGLLSDAVESLINLAAALIAVWALTLASRPPDAEHAYGHTKAEYFAADRMRDHRGAPKDDRVHPSKSRLRIRSPGRTRL